MTSNPLIDGERSQAPRRAIGLMFDPVFGGMFWGKLLSAAGVWIHSIVAAIVVFDSTGSAFIVGLVSVVQFTPQLVLSPISGTWADRGHAERQILLGRILCMLGSGSLATWMMFSPDTEGNALVLAVLSASLLVGLGFVVGGPAMQSIIPDLIRPGELSTAMVLNTAPMTIARIAGPALGALVAVHMGAASAFGIAAAAHLLFVVVIVIVKIPKPRPKMPGRDYSVRFALAHIRNDRALLLLLIAVAGVGFGSEPSMTLAPATAQELGGGTRLVGELSTAFGVGAGIGFLCMTIFVRRVASAVASTLGLWCMIVGLGGAAVSPNTWSALGAFALAGFGFSTAMAGLGALVQERAPVELRGRIMAFWMMGFVGSRPLSAALVGSIADASSVRIAFSATAALLAVIGILCRPRRIGARISAG